MKLDYEQLLITNELSEIIRWHNQTLERLRSYREQYPYLLPPNVGKMMEENLKENTQMLYRELNNLHKPKTEQRRHVCRHCHHVYAMALVGGICDECRSRMAHSQPDYEAATQAAASRALDATGASLDAMEGAGDDTGENAAATVQPAEDTGEPEL